MKIHSILLSLYIVQINTQEFGTKCNNIPIHGFTPPSIGSFGTPKGNCNEGLVCYNDICKYDIGHKCSKDSDCGQYNNICFHGKCETKGSLGHPCKLHKECYSELICGNIKNGKGHCASRKYLPVGHKCKSTVECEFGCIKGKCDKKWGGGCTNDSDCSSGIICWCGSCCGSSIAACREKKLVCL